MRSTRITSQPLADEKGWLRDGISDDGLHPNAEGYKAMTAVLVPAIQKALGQ